MIKVGNKVPYKDGEIRIMAVAEKWAMARYKGAMPFCVLVSELEAAQQCVHPTSGDSPVSAAESTPENLPSNLFDQRPPTCG